MLAQFKVRPWSHECCGAGALSMLFWTAGAGFLATSTFLVDGILWDSCVRRVHLLFHVEDQPKPQFLESFPREAPALYHTTDPNFQSILSNARNMLMGFVGENAQVDIYDDAGWEMFPQVLCERGRPSAFVAAVVVIIDVVKIVSRGRGPSVSFGE